MGAVRFPTDAPSAFEILASGRADLPTLRRAVEDQRPAPNIRIEWQVDALVSGKYDEPNIQTVVWHNYQQIFRAQRTTSPDKDVDTAAHEAAEEVLAAIEKALVYGIPYRDYSHGIPYSTLGGYRHYLGRPLNDNDILRLRPLREPFLRVIDRDQLNVPLDWPICEWIAETSLQVIPQAP